MREEITLKQALSLLEDYHTSKISVVTVHLLTQYPNKTIIDTGFEDGVYALDVKKNDEGVITLESDYSTITFREDQCFLVNVNKSKLGKYESSEIILYIDVIGKDKDETRGT